MAKWFFAVFLTFLSTTGCANSSLHERIKLLEQESGGRIGVAVLDTATQQLWDYRGSEPFPLMSTFKTLACAKLLFDSDKGKVDLQQAHRVKASNLLAWSPVTEQYTGKKLTLEKLCRASMVYSDNTAINLVLKSIGGPQEVTAFLRQNGDRSTRLDRIEPELNQALEGDLRDTTTPVAIVGTLRRLLYGRVLEKASRAKLKNWMLKNRVSDSLLRSILPADISIADRSGAGGNGSRAITAVIWRDRQKPLIIAVYLTQTRLTLAQRDKIIVEIGKEIFKEYRLAEEVSKE